MSQNASANPFVLELASPANPPTSPAEPQEEENGGSTVELQANAVMDDIFGDVESLLRDRATLAVEPAFAEPSFSPLIALPGLGVSELVASKTATPDVFETGELSLTPLPAIALESSLAQPALEQPTPAGRAFDRLLLAIACAALVGTASVWFLLQTRLRQSSAVVATSPDASATQVTPTDQKFLDYLSQSLNVIDQKAEINRENSAVASAANGALPRVAVAGGPTRPGSSSTVLERVYIPVYQPPQAFNVPTLPAPSATTVQPGVPTQPAAAPAQTTAVAPQNIAPATQHVLVGVLELGDRSAALFELNGTPRRVQIGEAIGNSGWTLVAIRNQEAIVRRNGEVRSIYVGQRF